MRVRPRAVAAEAAIVVALGTALTAASLGLLSLQFGETLRLGAGDLPAAGAAGITTAVIIRVTVRLHRRWKKTIGRFTAAAALCGLAALAGTLVVMIPSSCPGALFSTGRCGVREAAAWGQVAGLAAVVNLALAGLVLGLFRGIWGVIRDGSAQVRGWFGTLDGRRWRPGGRWSKDRPRRTGSPHRQSRSKDRPTPRRADAERARRERLRTRT